MYNIVLIRVYVQINAFNIFFFLLAFPLSLGFVIFYYYYDCYSYYYYYCAIRTNQYEQVHTI